MAKTVVITGASDGIGLAAAEKFLSCGWNVINLSRRPSPVEGVINIKTDVTDEENVNASFSEIQDKYGIIDCLVNNAGFGISGAIEYTEIKEAQRQFDVNFFGAVRCIKASLPMLRTSGGRIINISSAASVFAVPFQSFYSASKSSLDVITKALANEIKNSGVTVCSLQLGDAKTSFTSERSKSFAGDEKFYHGIIKKSVSKMEKDEENGLPPSFIADAIYKAAIRKHQKVISAVGAKYRVLTTISKVLPSEMINDAIALIYIPKA